MGNWQAKRITIDQLAGMVENGFAEMRDEFSGLRAETRAEFAAVNKRIDNLSYKVDRLDQKLDHHRKETKESFDTWLRVVGGLAHTLDDHEERIKELEGE